MKIAIIAEGSYPYITGGVSGWIHGLITAMPEHEFIVFAIGAKSSDRGNFKYKLPANVTEVKEVFLDAYMEEEGAWGRRFRLTAEQRSDFFALLGGGERVDWGRLFDLVRSSKFKLASEFLGSKDYFDILEEICRDKYLMVPFTEMFWTVRSMILPLLLTLRHDIPKADVYHAVSTGYAGVIGALAKHVHGSPLVLTEHGIYSREREEEIIKADWVKGYFKDLWIEYLYRLSACIYERADSVITLFNRNKEIQIEMGCEPSKISIVPNGVHADEYAGLAKPSAGGKLRIGAIVRIVPIKDIKTMLRSFALVRRQLPEAELFVMGPTEEDEEYYGECLQLTAAMGIEGVTFTGRVDIKEHIGQMDMLMLTSISEGQPLAVLEGMAAGKPVVATNVGSCQELLGGADDGLGPAGLIAPVMNYELIAKHVLRLAASPGLREEMGRSGLERVRRHYKQTDVIESYRSLYGALKEGKKWPESALN